MRGTAALATVVLAVLGLLTWEVIALGVSFVALVIACVALWRTEQNGGDLERWKTGQALRADAQGEALTRDLGD